MPKKTASDYSADILQLHVELSNLPEYHPEYDKLTRQLSNRLDKWQKLLDITIYAASNEQTPWQLEGMSIKPMPLKSDCGYTQIGDYLFTIKESAEIQSSDILMATWGNLCVERKTCQDLYGTLSKWSSYERFLKEIARYKADDRFNQMVVIVECNKEDYLTYIPEVYIASFNQYAITRNKNLKRFFKSYYKLDINHFTEVYNPSGFLGTGPDNHIVIKSISDTESTLHIDGVLRETLSIKQNYGKLSLYLHRGASVESRRAKTAKLITKGIHVEWAGNRTEAQKTYLQLVRQSCIKNYKSILNLE